MEAHAPSAAQARINRVWGPLHVKAVPQIQSLYLAVPVSATPATRGKTEAHARGAALVHLRNKRGL